MNVAVPPLPQYTFMAWCSVKKKHRGNFTFTSLDICLILTFCELPKKERRDGSFEKTTNVSRVYDFLKCHKNVSKQTNPLQVDDLIKNKPLANLRPLEDF
jgi:hypothetical protein